MCRYEMVYFAETGVFIGAIVLGTVHGIEPGHGWPVAASYALDKANTWLFGFLASFIIGFGHLVSSIAMVAAFFYAKAYFELAEVDEPIRLVGDIYIGGPVSLVAGFLLILLGIREYFYGHSHGHDIGGNDPDSEEEQQEPPAQTQLHPGNEAEHEWYRAQKQETEDGYSTEQSHANDDDHGHSQDNGNDHAHDTDHNHDHDLAHDNDHEHGHDHDHSHSDSGIVGRIKSFIPFVGGHDHSHGTAEEAAERGLLGIAWFAFLLGFAHEEEFEIIALCAGSDFCLELMLVYAVTVIVAIVALTMLLIAGYHHFEERVEQYTPYLPAFSAVVLIIMGVGFILGLF
jgi:nickel/cobalt exporter